MNISHVGPSVPIASRADASDQRLEIVLLEAHEALVVLAVLCCAAAATAMAFFRVDRAAGSLLVPHLAWISFALVLNASIVAMN
jgi:tryptophan-rich sensory protein